jgi:hypothetical protein
MKTRIRTQMIMAALLICTTTPAMADDTWLVLPLRSRGVDTLAVETFADLLRDQIRLQLKARIVNIPNPIACADAICARNSGSATNANLVGFGSVNALGSKLIVSLTVVDSKKNTIAGTQKITVDRVEDLEAASVRIAKALAQGGDTEDAAELGTITRKEIQPPKRREGIRGVTVRVGAIVPLDDGYANMGAGVLVDLGYWYETKSIALHPRVGVRFDADPGPGLYVEMPIDFNVNYIFGLGDLAPYIGAGAGLRMIWEERPATVTVGSVMPAVAEKDLQDFGVGFGASGRVGMMFLRTYTMRLNLAAEYNVAVVPVNNRKLHQSLTFNLGAIF